MIISNREKNRFNFEFTYESPNLHDYGEIE